MYPPDNKQLIQWRLSKLEEAVESISASLEVLEDFRKEYIVQRRLVLASIVIVFGFIQPLMLAWLMTMWGPS